MDARFEAIVIECLSALEQGESVGQILARYPDDAAELRPLLAAATALSELRMEPSEATKIKSRRAFLNQAAALRSKPPRKAFGVLPRLAAGFVAVVLVLGVLGTSAVAASGSAVPGDPLYGIKRTIENIQLNLTASSNERDALLRQFEQRRLDEANQLLDTGRESEVEFTGTIESIQPGAWIVSGLVVQLNGQTQIVGTPQIDRVAQVRGSTGPNGLRASSITIEAGGEIKLTPTPEPTKPLAPTMTPKPTQTPEPTQTPTHTPAAASTSRPIPTQTAPTALPQPAASPQPTEAAQPSATPQPVEVEFSGTVNSIGAGAWIIDGVTVTVNGDTEMSGSINVGQRVKVQAVRLPDGQLIARHIELGGGGGGDNSQNTNTNQNSNSNENRNENQNQNQNLNENHNDNSNHNGDDSNNNTNSNQNSHDDHGGNGNGNDNGGSSSNGNDH